MSTLEPHYITVGGHRLEYTWSGPPPDRAPTLVFLHEGLGCVSLWHDFPAAVAAATGCGALVYSREGYGRSSPAAAPRPVTFLHHHAREVLPELLAALGVRDAFLIGHSDGASIALLYAGAMQPSARVLAIACLAPHVFVEAQTVASITRLRDAYATTSSVVRTSLHRHHGPDTDRTFHGWADVWLSPAFTAWNIEDVLPRITCPVLVVQGDDDEYGSLRQVDAIAAGTAGPVTTRPLAGCGHAPHRERRAETVAAIVELVRSAVPGSTGAAAGATIEG